MSDDIVTRLREIPATIEKLGAEWVPELDAARLALESADEIERLRADNQTLRKQVYEGDHSWDEIRKWNERLQQQVNVWMGAAERFAESHPQFEAFRYYFQARRNER